MFWTAFFFVPFLGIIIAAILAVLTVVLASFLFGWFSVSILHLFFLGAGIYFLVKFAIPNLFREGRVFRQYALVLTLLALLFIVLGVPNLIFGIAGTGGVSYSVVPLH
jgi:hypothetical protein